MTSEGRQNTTPSLAIPEFAFVHLRDWKARTARSSLGLDMQRRQGFSDFNSR